MNRFQELLSIAPLVKKPKRKFTVIITAEIENEVDEDGFASATSLAFEVDEAQMNVFQQILNKNGYLYTVEPWEGEINATYQNNDSKGTY